MKIELISNDSFNIFINKEYFKDVNFQDKDNIIDIVKDLVLRLKNKLCMNGFYKVKAYVNERVGLFLDVLKIEEIEFSNNIDLRVIVCLNENVLFELEDICDLPKNIKVRSFHNKYYIDIDDVDNLYDILEFGRFVYGNELNKVLNGSKLL